MANQSMAQFLQACGAAGPLRLGVEYTAGREALRREFEQPFLLVGREAQADLPLDDPAVSKRHAYLQVIAGHLFCLDLRSRTGILWDGQPRHSGWLEPGRAVGIGPFAVRLLGNAGAAGAAENGDPLAALPPDQDPLPPVSLDIRSGSRESASWQMDRVLALVGQTAQGTLRVGGRSVLRPSCGLLRTPRGLWVIDLLAPEGLSVNGVRVRWAHLETGDELRVGRLSLRVRCHTPPAPPHGARERPDALAPGVPPSGEAEQVERQRLRAEQQAATAEGEQLRARLSAVERSLAEASAARDELVKAGQEAAAWWEVERLALGEQWEQEQRARAEEKERFDAARHQWQQEAAVLRRDSERLAAELEGRQGQEAALQQDLEKARIEAADARRQGQEQWDAAHRQFEEERRQRQEEAAVLQRDSERLAAELARAAAGSSEAAEQRRALRAELEGRQGQEAALRKDLEAARAEAADVRRQGQEQRDAAHRQFEEERRQRQQEAERVERERRRAEQQAAAEAEQLRARLSAVERSLAEASAARDELVKAGQEAAAWWEVERLALGEQWEQEQRARAEEKERFDADRHQWQEETAALRRDSERLAAELEGRQGQEAALRKDLEAACAEAADARRQGQEQWDAAHRQFEEERRKRQEEAERLRQEAATLRQDSERLATELARTVAGGSSEPAEQLRALRAELEGQQGQEAALRQDLEKARIEAADARRQGQEQWDAAHRQFEEERRKRQEEAERLRLEVAILRRQCEGLIRQVSTGSCDAALTAPPAPQAPAAPARRVDRAALDAFFLALSRSPTSSGDARPTGDGGRPPSGS